VEWHRLTLQQQRDNAHVPMFTIGLLRHHAVCLATGPQPLPKRVLHRGRSGASPFNFRYLLISLRSSSSCLHLIPCLPVPSISPSIMRFRRQSLRKMRWIQLAFVLCYVGRSFPLLLLFNNRIQLSERTCVAVQNVFMPSNTNGCEWLWVGDVSTVS
jgi:hypothetical protein